MYYIASYKSGNGKISHICNTVAEAEKWLDENNNNAELTTTVEEVNESGDVIDWYYYTKG